MNGQHINIQKILFIVFLYIFLYSLNYLMPMGFGDDYLYSFIWQGNPEFVPLTDNAIRVSSWYDLYISQLAHYLTWSGRTVNHTLAQLLLWIGKEVFNYFNAFVGVLLVVEIYWCVNRGRIAFDFKIKDVWKIFIALWAFTPGFVTVFLWLDGACNYLWPSVLLLGFMLPYVRKYYRLSQTALETSEQRYPFGLAMLFFGVLTGWTNENSICWILIVLFVFLFYYSKRTRIEKWLYCGLAGLLIGYVLLMLAPGNIARLQSVHGLNGISLAFVVNVFHNYLSGFSKVIFFQFLMWYFCLRTLLKLKQASPINQEMAKDIFLVKVLCFVAFGMSAVMLLSPEFPLRSGFPGTVLLIIATGVLLRISQNYKIKILAPSTKKFMWYVSIVYFVVTSFVSLYNLYNLHRQTEDMITYVKHNRQNYLHQVLTVKPFKKPGKAANLLSGFHIVENNLMEDENSWENVAFARYYGIKGIRVQKEGTGRE